MATTIGAVLSLTWVGTALCSQIGTPGAAELLIIQFVSSDSPAVLGAKRSMIKLLTRVKAAGYTVTVAHGDSDAAITSVQYSGFNICPARATVDDFFTVSGAEFADDTVVVFDGPSAIITVTPDVVLPDWVLIAHLPASIPTTRQTVQLRSSTTGWSSDIVPIDVSSGVPEFVRRLYSGAPKDSPYTIALTACPAILTSAGALVADPVISNRPSFHSAVSFAIDNFLRSTEDVLQKNGRNVQFVSVFDATRAASDEVALVQEDTTNIIMPRRDLFKSFHGAYVGSIDIAFALSGSATHTRSSAFFGTDDTSKPSVSFTYVGITHVHGRFANTPGTVALSTSAGGLAALHEFGHASSDVDNGMILDLYIDGVPPGTGHVINKKWRVKSTDQIPTVFANYNSTTYNSDQSRDSLGYPMGWASYHSELLDALRPNMMDNFFFAANPRRCRLDKITYAWLTDRLEAKMSR